MKIFNEFGIKPTTNCKAAGYDFYIPNIKVSPEDGEYIFDAFVLSYKKSKEELKNLLDELVLYVTAQCGEEKVSGNEMNILLLFLALDSGYLRSLDNFLH